LGCYSFNIGTVANKLFIQSVHDYTFAYLLNQSAVFIVKYMHHNTLFNGALSTGTKLVV